MVDWNKGKPNARLWVLKLLHDNFGPGDKIVEIALSSPFAPEHPYLDSLAVLTKAGKRKMLLVNKRDRDLDLSIVGTAGGHFDYVDVTTGFHPPASTKLASDKLMIRGFSVGVLTFP